MIPSKQQWKSWSLPSKYTAIAIPLTLAGILVSFLQCSSTKEPSRLAESRDTKYISHHIVANYFDLKVRGNHVPETLRGSFVFQARRVPLLLNNDIKIERFNIDQEFFDIDELFNPGFEISSVELSRISLEEIGDSAEVKVTLNVSMLFFDTSYSVRNPELAEGRHAGVVYLGGSYADLNGKEHSYQIRVPIKMH